MENGVSWNEFLSFFGSDTAVRKQELVEWYIRGTTVAVNRTLDTTMAIGENDDTVIANVAQVYADVVQAWDGSKMAIIAELFKDSALNFVSFLQGFALMILYMVIPIIMLIGGYSLSTMVSIGLAIFALNFMPVLWALVAWVDNSVGMALYADRNTLSTLALDGSIDAVKSQAVLSLVVGALYLSSGPMLMGFLSLGNRSLYGVNNAVGAMGAAPDIGVNRAGSLLGNVESNAPRMARAAAANSRAGSLAASAVTAAVTKNPGVAVAVKAATIAKRLVK